MCTSLIIRLEDYYEDSNSLPVAVGGLSITGVMADFSMYIFHPYGGKKSCKLIDNCELLILNLCMYLYLYILLLFPYSS